MSHLLKEYTLETSCATCQHRSISTVHFPDAVASDVDRLAPVDFQVSSTAQQIAARLRSSLLHGRLGPGTPLEEAKLVVQFGVSRNTVREALQLLASENLVVRARHRTVVVREVGDPADVTDLYRARGTLEHAALPGAIARPASWHEELYAALDRIGIATDRIQIDEADLAFHGLLVSAIGSTRVDLFYARIHTELRLTRGWALRAPADPAHVVASHRPLVEALAGGNLEAASAMLQRILDTGEHSLIEAIRVTAQ